jgi:GNAT superfamily N-acetyltransferase
MIRVARLCLYERWLEAPVPPGTLPPGVELAVLEAPAQAREAGRPWQPEAEQRLREGQVCAVALHGGDVVAYCWLSQRPVLVAEIDRLVVPRNDEVYLYDAFTLPAWRGRGLFRVLLLRLLAFAHAKPWRRALIFARAGNRASRRAIERAEFQLFRIAWRAELWGLELRWFQGLGAGRSRVNFVARAPMAAPPAGPEKR